MVYGYDTNEEFIDKSYQLLEKLEKKDLWNKDTLVIGLDKRFGKYCFRNFCFFFSCWFVS